MQPDNKAYIKCIELLRMRIYPTPTLLNEELHGHKSRNINGRETVARRMALERYGYVKGTNGRWTNSHVIGET